MEHIRILKRIIFVIILFTFINCYSQNELKNPNDIIYGRWKCVKHDYGGYNSFTFEQAEAIRTSILNIEKNKIYYTNINFVGKCDYSKFKVTPYDTTLYLGLIIEFRYTKRELSKIMVYDPVDKNGDFACFNDCAIFYLKQDTLINICGGYTFFLIKEK
jgi:hypothetical protein